MARTEDEGDDAFGERCRGASTFTTSFRRRCGEEGAAFAFVVNAAAVIVAVNEGGLPV